MVEAEATPWTQEVAWRHEMLHRLERALAEGARSVQAYEVEAAVGIVDGVRHWLRDGDVRAEEVAKRARVVALVKKALVPGQRVSVDEIAQAEAALGQEEHRWLDMSKAQVGAPTRRKTLPLSGSALKAAGAALRAMERDVKDVAVDLPARAREPAFVAQLCAVKGALVSGNVPEATLLDGARLVHAFENALRRPSTGGGGGGGSSSPQQARAVAAERFRELQALLAGFDAAELRKQFTEAELAPQLYSEEERLPDTFAVDVLIVGCRELRAADWSRVGRSSDPYVTAACGGATRRTPIKHRTCAPVFTELMHFSCGTAAPTELAVQVLDWDRFNKDDALGSVRLPLDWPHAAVGEGGIGGYRLGAHELPSAAELMDSSGWHALSGTGEGGKPAKKEQGAVRLAVRLTRTPGEVVRKTIEPLTGRHSGCVLYEVTLGDGPLGIVFRDAPTDMFGGSAAQVQSVFGAVAESGLVKVGHYLYSVNAASTAAEPFGGVLAMLREAERPVQLGFGDFVQLSLEGFETEEDTGMAKPQLYVARARGGWRGTRSAPRGVPLNPRCSLAAPTLSRRARPPAQPPALSPRSQVLPRQLLAVGRNAACAGLSEAVQRCFARQAALALACACRGETSAAQRSRSTPPSSPRRRQPIPLGLAMRCVPRPRCAI